MSRKIVKREAPANRDADRNEGRREPAFGGSRGVWRGRFAIAIGMLVAVLGGAWMGVSAITVSSGRSIGLLELYAAVAITAGAARIVHRRGGMFSLLFYAGMAGLATIIGPMLAM